MLGNTRLALNHEAMLSGETLTALDPFPDGSLRYAA